MRVDYQRPDLAMFRACARPSETHGPPAPISRRERRRRAADARDRRRHWHVIIAQGLSIREAPALEWLALREFWAALRRDPRYPSAARSNTIRAVYEAAGGVLPPTARGVEETLQRRSSELSEKRNKRQAAKPMPRDERTVRERFDSQIRRDLTAALTAAAFHRQLSPTPKVEVKIRLSTEESSSRKMSITAPRGQPRGDRRNLIEIDIRRDWHRTVFRAGLANVLGPRTLVLEARVDGNGTWLVAAVQTGRGTNVRIKRGYLSRNAKQEPILR